MKKQKKFSRNPPIPKSKKKNNSQTERVTDDLISVPKKLLIKIIKPQIQFRL